MDALDGNAIGGLMQEVFGTEMTTATGMCATCGAAAQLAECVVYLRAPGTVARCRSCGSVVMVIVKIRDMNCVDLRGLATLTASSP
jgi:DNA-directed RNA polymerase subunit RPC12/RpoP